MNSVCTCPGTPPDRSSATTASSVAGSRHASERRATSTPLQALVLLNDPFVRRMAATLAERVKGDVALAYRLTLGREPTAEETARAAATAKEHGMSTVAWALFNSAEFLHVR